MDSAHPASDYEDFDKPYKSQKLETQNPEEQIINFGKHKGKKWKDLPQDYLIWIAESPKSFFSRAIREIAKSRVDKQDEKDIKIVFTSKP
ncbi:MAG: DUF3820 family protein [bacterium]|nr:DUF3820 family protein [bacterium]